MSDTQPPPSIESEWPTYRVDELPSELRRRIEALEKRVAKLESGKSEEL